MTATAEPAPAPRLWTPDGFVADEWSHAESAEAAEGGGRFILPLGPFLDLGGNERAGGRFGVLLQPAEAVEALEPHLQGLPLVALSFPAFSDGRSFSKAELLRSRYRYPGLLRATGQVLVDQLPHMLRLGFTQFEINNPVLLRRLEEGHTGGLPLAYQPTAEGGDEPPASLGRSYSWRRVPRQ